MLVLLTPFACVPSWVVMSVLPLIIYPDPVLTRRAAEVTEYSSEVRKLAADMVETMYHADGVGLAAPQVGVSQRVFVADVSTERNAPVCIINPIIVERAGAVQWEEGCLSIPGYRGMVGRSASVKIAGFDPSGNPLTIEAEGLQAVCFQHEIDHLDGVLFIDHLSQLKRDLFRRWWAKHKPA